jgi:hypothetical protein
MPTFTTSRAPIASWPWARQVGAHGAAPEVMVGLQLVSATLGLPFDVMREQHAQGVHAGLMANSMLESRDFEKTIDALEHATLGPFARHC